ncbi:MCE associated membrane protein [Mycolicibacterium fortuitum]|uniref:MCE associated membrane protein n=1 Tax=Mycolicibacterium fortuitum TaxID=1766 RepID=A0A378UWQ4_MYCFO|nr:MCE associated membrane protein [Mycolicibacterium fortuitum]
MSGRHTMPPAGRRKAAADAAASAEPVAADQAGLAEPGSEPASPEAETIEHPASETAVVEESDDANAVDEPDETGEPATTEPATAPPRARSRVSAAVVLAVIALVLAVASGVLRWLTVTQAESDTARVESVEAAKEITAEMLSYETDTVEQQLTAARDRMTGKFLGTYTAMINEVIPAAQAQRIAAVADVLEVGTVKAEPDRAELVLFVNQSVQVGDHMPEKTPSVARVTMVKDGDRWLLSEYEPVPL